MQESPHPIPEEPSLIDLKTDLVKALTHSERDFKVLVELLPVSILVHRGDKIIYVNPSWLKLLGYERAEELIGKSPLETVHPEHRKRVEDRINRLNRGAAHNTLAEQMLAGKNGEAVPAEIEEVSIVYNGIPSVLVVARDISKRRKAQEALRKSEENLKAILEKMPDAVVVNDPDRILFVNQNLVRLLGYETAEELVGRSPLDLIHPDYHPVVRERIDNAFGNGGQNPLLEYKWVKKNGGSVDVEVSSMAVMFGGQKAVTAFGRDVSERNKSQEALKESHYLLERAQQAGHVGTWIADIKQGDVLWSEESYKIFGIEQGKFGGKKANFLSLVHPEDLSTLREVNDKAVRGATGFDLEFRIVRPDGAVRWIHSQSEVIRDAGGHAIKIIGTAQDVTERKEAEKLRHKMERQAALNDRLATVGTLAAGVAHEINNPLTYVMANLISVKDHLEELRGYLVRKNLMDSKLFGLLNELQEETLETDGGIDRIRDIVRSLKTYMHSGGGEKESIDVNKLIDSALNMVFHEIKYKARVEKAYGVNLPPLKANSGKVHQVLINLLMNAVQAIEPKKPDHNRIGVRTGLEGENLFIEIQDTGQGIPEENLKKIFDPFFTTKPAGVGTGLGLSICHQIIREYGGQIRVRSRVGHGSTFTVLLPLTQGIGTVQNPACSAQPLSAHKRILVVDDEPANVDTFGRMLRKDHQVLYALSGLDALNILEREKAGFDAIVSDVNMPDMDGVGLYKNISVKYPGLEKRMVFVTGGVFSTETRDFLKSLSNPLLEKPFPTPDLLKAIAGLPSGA